MAATGYRTLLLILIYGGPLLADLKLASVPMLTPHRSASCLSFINRAMCLPPLMRSVDRGPNRHRQQPSHKLSINSVSAAQLAQRQQPSHKLSINSVSTAQLAQRQQPSHKLLNNWAQLAQRQSPSFKDTDNPASVPRLPGGSSRPTSYL
jgi:hypothetical protein